MRVEAGGNAVGDIVEADFPEQLRAAEGGMDEVVRLGLFRLVDEQARELREHYDDADDLIETWEDIVEPQLERRIRTSSGPLAVVNRVVFRLYRTV
jgi:hypothetical protein